MADSGKKVRRFMAVPANPNWMQRRKPLPILFAETVRHPDRERFMKLYKNISAQSALQEAQEILIRCGAVGYCVVQLLLRYQAARNILEIIPLNNKGTVDLVIAPVSRLFDTLGISPQNLITKAGPESLGQSNPTGALSQWPPRDCVHLA